jgi:hypothetical protein
MLNRFFLIDGGFRQKRVEFVSVAAGIVFTVESLAQFTFADSGFVEQN